LIIIQPTLFWPKTSARCLNDIPTINEAGIVVGKVRSFDGTDVIFAGSDLWVRNGLVYLKNDTKERELVASILWWRMTWRDVEFQECGESVEVVASGREYETGYERNRRLWRNVEGRWQCRTWRRVCFMHMNVGLKNNQSNVLKKKHFLPLFPLIYGVR